MTVTVNTQFDTTQRELVVDIASLIYQYLGYEVRQPLMYFYESQHPTEKAVLAAAEEIYEIFVGDSPSYDDEEEEANAKS